MSKQETAETHALVTPSGSLLLRSIGAPTWYAAMIGEAARPQRTAGDILAEGFRIVRVRVEVLPDV